MLADYHRAIVDAQYGALCKRATEEHWTNVTFERNGALFYVTFPVEARDQYTYVARIDMRRYPVDPYWVGFINADLPRTRWDSASDSDPRFWPWSPMPGLHGSFNLTFQGPYRTFWCRECNFPFFQYHPDRRWVPREWPLDRVVAHLRHALELAEPPTRWRPIEQQVILAIAARGGIIVPADAGLGAK